MLQFEDGFDLNAMFVYLRMMFRVTRCSLEGRLSFVQLCPSKSYQKEIIDVYFSYICDNVLGT